MNVSKIVKDAIEEYHKGNYNKAMELYKKTLPNANYSDLGTIYYNLGLCHYSLYNYKAAEVSFKKAFDTYGYENCGYELAMSSLFNGKLEQGMLLYRYRNYGVRDKLPKFPILRVETTMQCVGKRVLVINEEGYGDEIMFSRAIPELSKSAKNVAYKVYDKMFPLFKEQFENLDNVEFFIESNLPVEFVMSFDCWITSGDLFADHILKHGMQHQPFKSNSTLDNTLDIGITWAANVLSGSAKVRSLSVEDFKDALIGENTSITSLQYNQAEPWMQTTDISDFRKTFDVIRQLDIVVTVDTVTAHLAGMMNKPTVLVYDKYLDWRWKYFLYNRVTIVHISKLKDHMDTVRKDFFK